MSDIIPTIHSKKNDRKSFQTNALLLLFGALVVGAVISITHAYIDTGHGHDHGHESSENCVDYYDKDGEKILWQDCDQDGDGHMEHIEEGEAHTEEHHDDEPGHEQEQLN